MNRRSFIGNILALGAAPAIVRADSLMRIVPRDLGIFIPYVAEWPETLKIALYSSSAGSVLLGRFDLVEVGGGDLCSVATTSYTFDANGVMHLR